MIMMEKMMEHKPIAEKDMAEAKGLVAKLQMLAEKSGTSVEHLVEMASDQEGYEEEEGEEEEMEAPAAGPDKGKIALIIAKMKGQKAEE
jgi:hypothetical protein